MDLGLTVAWVVTTLIALIDVWSSRLSTGAKVMWSFTLIFLVGVGLAVWLLTRHSAHEGLEPLPSSE